MKHEVMVTWEEFEVQLQEIRETTKDSMSELLFRGQSDSEWKLATTLERRTDNTYSFLNFYRMVYRIRPEIESYTGTRWDMPEMKEAFAWSKEYDQFTPMPTYDFISHLRHNGFPSPLLDWTQSPYVAAYFAFAQARRSSNVAIYVFCEMPHNIKGRSSNEPQIKRLGRHVRTHPRHFRQQSDYTICARYQGSWGFVPHQEVFDTVTHNEQDKPYEQDKLWKFVIPTTERMKVLKILDDYNLNAYSLFGSEESLMETMAFRDIEVHPYKGL